jgi:magnesium transporter
MENSGGNSDKNSEDTIPENADQRSPEELSTVEEQVEQFQLIEAWSALTNTERKEKFSSLPRTEAEELFLSLKTRDQAELIAEASSLEKRSWVRLLAPDDVADLIQELGADYREEIMALLDPQTRREVTALLAYSEDKAGGLMSSRYLRLRPDMSVDEAISYIRIQSKTQIETIYYAYVLDIDQTLLGVVSFRELFAAAPHKKIRDIMKEDLVRIPVSLDQEQAAKIFAQANLLAVPVVDEWNHMKGIVTFDDIANVVQEEATEDIQKIGGLEALDAPYLKVDLFELYKKRAVWLIVLFIAQMLTATAMGFFQTEIEKAVVLALFIPLIISSGGNSGSQASTLIIRSLALGEIRLKDWLRVLRREILVGVFLGLTLGVFGFLRIVFWPDANLVYGDHFFRLGLAVMISVVGVVLWGTIAGSMLPLFLKRLHIDPATASAPFVATLVDVTGLIIYFSVAALVLSGTVL